MSDNRRSLPQAGQHADVVFAAMNHLRAGDTGWTSPRNLTASYYGGPEVAAIAREAFLRHIGDNVIQQAALHPSVSVLCVCDKGLERWQGFASDAWNGGAYVSKTITGSRNAGPVASAWATVRYLGGEFQAAVENGRRNKMSCS